MLGLPGDYSLPERVLAFGCPLLLGVLSVTSLVLRYVTEPVTCWMPPQFTDSMARYARDVCFQQTVIELFGEDGMVLAGNPRHTYHQWVPFALGTAAILCVLPHVIWRMLSGLLWLDTHALAQTLADNQRHNAATRHVMLKDSALVVQAGLRGGNWTLTAAAVVRKVAVCLVCVLQLSLILLLFDPQLGARSGDSREDKSSEDGMEEQEEQEPQDNNSSIPLPEHFACSLEIMHIQNVSKYLLQCLMPLAYVYSKGFTFLFYLFLLLAVCCVLDMLTFLGRLAIPGLRDLSLQRYLAVSEPQMDPQLSAVRQRFLHSLGMDGRLVLAVTADLCGPVAAADLSNHLWMTFKASPRPAALLTDPAHGQAAGVTTVSTVPSAGAAAGSAPAPTVTGSSSSAKPEAVPLIPVGKSGEQR